ncbi:MAG: dihydroorotate dehydrogenase-like protein, partial [Spirochaetaceae bacterium]
MANLESSYMGIGLKSPLIVGACSLTSHMKAIKKIEEAGAGALIIKSLFEEEIQLEKYKMEEDIVMYDDWHAEMTDIFPDKEHAGPDEHLMWVRKTKEEVGIPVIASLNAVTHDTWVEWAQKLQDTGVDGLELNFFATPTSFDEDAKSIEDAQVEALRDVKKAVKIPVSVKLSHFYTNPLALVKRMADTGVDGFVLFNRMFHPSFDIEKESMSFPFNLSQRNDHRLPMRFAGLLYGNIEGSICASNGIHQAEDAVEVLLAGADVFQVVSTLYQNSLGIIEDINSGIAAWMDRKGYRTLDDFRGKLSAKHTADKAAYRRAQYVKMLLHADDYVKRPTLI